MKNCCFEKQIIQFLTDLFVPVPETQGSALSAKKKNENFLQQLLIQDFGMVLVKILVHIAVLFCGVHRSTVDLYIEVQKHFTMLLRKSYQKLKILYISFKM